MAEVSGDIAVGRGRPLPRADAWVVRVQIKVGTSRAFAVRWGIDRESRSRISHATTPADPFRSCLMAASANRARPFDEVPSIICVDEARSENPVEVVVCLKHCAKGGGP